MSAATFCDILSKTKTARSCTQRIATILMFVMSLTMFSVAFGTTSAEAETRTLRMYYTHTKESITVTFKKDGRYVKSGLRKLNRFLRDFRRNEPTRMDPKLFDLVWEVYQKAGAKKPIRVISGYRSPRTNAMLRRRGRKVATKSQHTRGKALDFMLPGVSISKLRALGLKAHVGGVGKYGAFVHLDTGRVRHWPRMSRRQLSRVFPRGRTIHVPSDGRPLKGYKVAAANLKRGLNYDGSKRKTKASASLLAGLFKKSGNDGDENESVAKKKTAKAKPTVKKKPTAKPAKTPAPTPAPTVVAKKSTGVDPFAAELTVAKKQKPKPEIVVAAAEPVTKPAVDETPAVPTPVTIPRVRPTPKVNVPNTQLALADPLETVSQTELALATPTIPTPSVARPSVNIPTTDTAALQTEQATEDLKARIRAALTRQRQLSNAEKATKKPILQASLTPAKPIVQASLAPTKAAAVKEVTKPSRRVEPAVIEAKIEVPVPKPQPKLKAPAKAPVRTKQPAEQAIASLTPNATMAGELRLGDLDGADVKKWAVAQSTRIGPIATLLAPVYDQGTRRAAPTLVYSAGFANNRPPLRADRFTGRAMTRVAFADVGRTN